MKKLRITVAGKVYEVTVEVLEEDNRDTSHPTKPVTSSSIHEPAVLALSSPAHAIVKGSENVTSPLAGRVVAISVHIGQTIKEGDQVMILEAMKMNNYIYAPRSGQISGIFVKIGDIVEEGQSLLTLV